MGAAPDWQWSAGSCAAGENNGVPFSVYSFAAWQKSRAVVGPRTDGFMLRRTLRSRSRGCDPARRLTLLSHHKRVSRKGARTPCPPSLSATEGAFTPEIQDALAKLGLAPSNIPRLIVLNYIRSGGVTREALCNLLEPVAPLRQRQRGMPKIKHRTVKVEHSCYPFFPKYASCTFSEASSSADVPDRAILPTSST